MAHKIIDELKDLKDVIDSFEDLSSNEDDRADFYLDRIINIHDNLTLNIAEMILEQSGPTKVYDFAEKLGINSYKYCPHCDADTPRIKETCLICGQEK